MTEEERTAKMIAETRKVLPEFPEKPKIVKNYVWDLAVNLEGPGQFKAVNDLKANHLNDIEGLHLAGDYQFLIASTEGSMDSGRRRAEDILAGMGIPAPKLQRPAPEPEEKEDSSKAPFIAAAGIGAVALLAFAATRLKK